MNSKEYAHILVRISISLIFLWFGINQLINPENFMGYLPNFILISEYARTAIIANGIFDLIFGSLLLAGLFTKIVALILALHLFTITLSLGYNDIAIRDFGLTLVTISIYLGGEDKWSLDYKRKHT
ncbi:MAG: DoxX family membrane protein [Nanoarchaeota archaeon]